VLKKMAEMQEEHAHDNTEASLETKPKSAKAHAKGKAGDGSQGSAMGALKAAGKEVAKGKRKDESRADDASKALMQKQKKPKVDCAAPTINLESDSEEDPEEGDEAEEQAEESECESDAEVDPDNESEKIAGPAKEAKEAEEAEEAKEFNLQDLMQKEKHNVRESKYAYTKAREQFQGTNKEWEQSFARAEIIKKMPVTELRRRKFKVEDGI
jgi:hypothetical protein